MPLSTRRGPKDGPGNKPRVLFVADAGPEIGGGHVMRCLTLARALGEHGAACAFAAPPAVERILDVFADEQVERAPVRAPDPGPLVEDLAGASERFEGFVFDSFRLDAEAHQSIARDRPALAIDNLADRPLACDLLMEPDPGRDARDYEGLVPPACRLLLGPDYALVRPQFEALRPQALARRKMKGPVARVLVSMGLTDVGGITARVVDRMLPRLGEARLDVVLGPDAPSLQRLYELSRRDPRVQLMVEVKDMASLMAQADFAVGAGGSSIWERCVLGLPSLLVVLADNQAAVGAWLERHAAAELADARAPDFDAAFDRGFTGLMRSADRRSRLARASAELCDGKGAGRVAEALLEAIAARLS
jgi:UDP-2,4-diacetamido-2,4,6-trideoxy-beta-L-altropyranose hydrolase